MRREQSLYERRTQRKTPGGLCFRISSVMVAGRRMLPVGVAPDQSLELCIRIWEAERERVRLMNMGVNAEQVQGSTPRGPPRPGERG